MASGLVAPPSSPSFVLQDCCKPGLGKVVFKPPAQLQWGLRERTPPPKCWDLKISKSFPGAESTVERRVS